ncbi:MAG: bifunctional folylpolyglutamate synthase/dihydrofolate synthase, partial [Candidatus Thermoplasmatota archaeon]|nr:bifunctional folylpolyglutamate synthase/dihydrofolate synthase [Candidatus Thermoplasmatota archaeon]
MKQQDDYDAAVKWLYGLQYFGMKLGLDNTRTLLAELGNPHEELRAIHVAGTNGKGSVCAFLTNILMDAGLKVGTYTSPHLRDFGERICIDN